MKPIFTGSNVPGEILDPERLRRMCARVQAAGLKAMNAAAKAYEECLSGFEEYAEGSAG